MGREDPQLKLRLSEALKERIAEIARGNGRSLNAEIIHRLEVSLDKDLDDRLPSEFFGLLTQLQQAVNGSESLFLSLWQAIRASGMVPEYLTQDIEASIREFGESKGFTREESIRHILISWLTINGFHPPKRRQELKQSESDTSE